MQSLGSNWKNHALLLSITVYSGFASAAGGIQKVNSFLNNILSVLRGASLAVVTIAIIWAGYKFLFKHADMGECLKIVAGGLLIGGAAELARFLLQ